METRINEQKIAAFREAYLANGLNAFRAAIAIGLTKRVARSRSHRLAKLVNLELRETFRARGIDEASQAGIFKRLLRSKQERIRLDTAREVNKILDAYPAEKQTAEPLTINLTVNMEL